MKNSLFILAIAATFMGGLTLIGCQSSTDKAEDARTDVKDAREDLREEQQEAAVAAQEAANEQAWLAFKSDSEIKIKAHETRIEELKADMKRSGKKMNAVYTKNMEALEQKNKDLKTRIESRNNTETDWETFKREFNHDLDELGKAFNNLAVDNKN